VPYIPGVTVLHTLRWSFLIPAVVIALALVGLFAVTEAAVATALAVLGQPPTALPALVAWVSVAVLAAIVAGMLWRLRRSTLSDYGRISVMGPESTEGELREGGRLDRLLQSAGRSSRLIRVVGVGQYVTVGEVTVELIAIELREQLSRLTVVIRDQQGRAEEDRRRAQLSNKMAPERDDIWVPLRPVLRLADDAGTNYAVLLVGGGGSGAEYRYEFLIGPHIPAGARRLTVLIEQLTDEPEFGYPGRPREARVVSGPWRFDVGLDDR